MTTAWMGRAAVAAVIVAGMMGCSGVEVDEKAAPLKGAAPETGEVLGEKPETVQALTDTAVPNVSLATVEEIAGFLDANQGKVLVINFWATWCAPCVHEMPELAAFYEEYKDRGVAFLSLSSDSPDDYESKLIPFVAEHELPFHVFAIGSLDPDELDQHLRVGMDFALPTTFVLDRDRNIIQKFMRNITKADLVRVVEPLLVETDSGPEV